MPLPASTAAASSLSASDAPGSNVPAGSPAGAATGSATPAAAAGASPAAGATSAAAPSETAQTQQAEAGQPQGTTAATATAVTAASQVVAAQPATARVAGAPSTSAVVEQLASPDAGHAQAGGENGADGDAAPGGPALAPRTAGATQESTADTAAQPGALPGVFSTVSSAAAVGSEASPLSSAAATVQAQAATTAGAGSGATALPGAGVGMQDMIDATRATIEIAARQGATQARIALHPEDLGHISIRLSQTSAGLLARVSAETPAAAQALADSRAELHQSLSSLGLSLLRLDISSFGQSETGDHEGRFAGSPSASRAPAAAEESESPETLGELEGAAAPAAIAGGALVDVLA